MNSYLKESDPEIYNLIEEEKKLESEKLRLIPSENYASCAVLETTGSILTNKYSEGYPKKRYYEGQQAIDKIELLAIKRAKKLFGAEHVNVQPNSGSPANMAVYFALLEMGDKILGMNLSHGGHLTHGSPVNFSGKYYNFISYGVDKETEMLDMDEVRKIAEKEKPKIILSGFTAYPRRVDFKAFHKIAESVGAISMADISHIAGLIAAGVHPSPFPFTDVVTTTTHKTLRGPRGAIILCKKKFGKAVDKAVFPGLQGGPHEHSIAAKAVAFKEAERPEFKEYAKQIVKNAKALAEYLMENGFKLVSDGTDTHLILINVVKSKGISGKPFAKALDKAGIICNFNTIPFDRRPPFDPSGVRIGTPAITSRGMKETEMKKIADFMLKVSENIDNEEALTKIAEEVKSMCSEFPAPGIERI
ncbi:serine hydroxymethyltransferase [bacterium (Candidatus Torokbacteria) CG_4_10_14_0_2_um_filter_35_8]|nr:MAG: serine hydroxymethyltransferase [bacterium (Candidatus Torokbacteria) CG_4_10_14_0_2_um_filter_35_8]